MLSFYNGSALIWDDKTLFEYEMIKKITEIASESPGKQKREYCSGPQNQNGPDFIITAPPVRR